MDVDQNKFDNNSMTPQAPSSGSQSNNNTTPNKGGVVDYDNEPPLLEELGINPQDIIKKFIAILTQRGFKEVSTYEDMAGAIFVLFLFGFCLLLVSTTYLCVP